MSRHLGCHIIRPTQSSSRVAREDVPLSTPPKKACWRSQSHARSAAAPLSWPLESSASSRFPSRVASPTVVLRGALTTPFLREPLRRSPSVRHRPTANNVPVMLTPRPLPHLKGGDEHPEGPTLVSDIDCEKLPEIFANSSRQFESVALMTEMAAVRNDIARTRKKCGIVVGRKAPGSHMVPRAYRRTKKLSHSVRQRHIGKVTSLTQQSFAMEDENSLSPWNCQRRSPDDDDEILVSACRRTLGSNHAPLEDTHVVVHSAAPVVCLMHTTTAPVVCSIERSLSPPEAIAVVDRGDAIGSGVADGEVYHSTFLAISSSDDDAPLLRVLTNEDATDDGKVITPLASSLVSIEASSQGYSREAYLLSVCIELMSRNAHSHTASRYFYTWRRHHEFRRLPPHIPSGALQTAPTVDCMSPPITMVQWEPRGDSYITHAIAIDPFASSSTTTRSDSDDTTRVGGEMIPSLAVPQCALSSPSTSPGERCSPPTDHRSENAEDCSGRASLQFYTPRSHVSIESLELEDAH